MVEYQMVSVGLLVEPESLWKRDKRSGKSQRKEERSIISDKDRVSDEGDEEDTLSIGFEYRPDLRDFIIQVSDLEGATDKAKEMRSDARKAEQHGLRILKRVETMDSEGGGDDQIVTRRPSRKADRGGRGGDENQSGRPQHSRNRYGRSTDGGERSVGGGGKSSVNCDYYRQKFLQEGIEHVRNSSEYAEWLKFDSTNLSAGQKVVKKISAQQKALEAEAEKLRKKVSGSSRSGSDTSQHSNKSFVPPKRKPTKLDPLPLQVRICLDDSPAIVKVM